MRYSFTGKNYSIPENIKERTMHKIGRMERLLPEDAEVHVTYSVEKIHNKIEVTIPLQKRILRAEVSSSDMLTALDEIVDILEKQMVKYRSRLRDRSRRDTSFKEEMNYIPAVEFGAEHENGQNGVIVIEKTKKFALKPMDAEEAVMEMEMLGHNFFVFMNWRTDEVNVVYKRKNGSYGLIEPEY